MFVHRLLTICYLVYRSKQVSTLQKIETEQERLNETNDDTVQGMVCKSIELVACAPFLMLSTCLVMVSSIKLS